MYYEDDYLWKRSRENLVQIYQDELCKIKYHKCEDIISLKVRRRLKEYGVLKIKDGRFLVLTELGKELLKPHRSTKT